MLVVVAVVALVGNALVLALAILAVAPAPNLPLWLVGVMVQWSSLLVVAPGGVGVGTAVVTAVFGGVVVAVIAALAGLAAIVIGAAPVRAGVRTARATGTPLSLRHYLARPTWMGRRPRPSFVFATPADA